MRTPKVNDVFLLRDANPAYEEVYLIVGHLHDDIFDMISLPEGTEGFDQFDALNDPKVYELLLDGDDEAVDHPQHYHPGTYEAIKVIEAWKLGFNLGNVVKYIARAAHKGNRTEDLQKALWYLERELA